MSETLMGFDDLNGLLISTNAHCVRQGIHTLEPKLTHESLRITHTAYLSTTSCSVSWRMVDCVAGIGEVLKVSLGLVHIRIPRHEFFPCLRRLPFVLAPRPQLDSFANHLVTPWQSEATENVVRCKTTYAMPHDLGDRLPHTHLEWALCDFVNCACQPLPSHGVVLSRTAESRTWSVIKLQRIWYAWRRNRHSTHG